MSGMEIVQVAGRWARLANGDCVTPVPSFEEFGFDGARFHASVQRFQRDPAGVLASDGVAHRTPSPSHAKSLGSEATGAQPSGGSAPSGADGRLATTSTRGGIAATKNVIPDV